MIKELSGLPTGVIGFEASGELKAEDYRDVILPALERAAAGGDVRFVVVIPAFHGMSGGALWQDLKVGIEHLRAWKRIALVTDIEWMGHMTTLFGWMTPGEVRHSRSRNVTRRSPGSPPDAGTRGGVPGNRRRMAGRFQVPVPAGSTGGGKARV
jgi:hypothetical protein